MNKNTISTTLMDEGMDPIELRSSVINSNLSEHIKELRKKQGLTREKLAKELGVPQYTIAQWENSNHDFTISDLCTISVILNIEDFLIKLLTNVKR